MQLSAKSCACDLQHGEISVHSRHCTDSASANTQWEHIELQLLRRHTISLHVTHRAAYEYPQQCVQSGDSHSVHSSLQLRHTGFLHSSHLYRQLSFVSQRWHPSTGGAMSLGAETFIDRGIGSVAKRLKTLAVCPEGQWVYSVALVHLVEDRDGLSGNFLHCDRSWNSDKPRKASNPAQITKPGSSECTVQVLAHRNILRWRDGGTALVALVRVEFVSELCTPVPANHGRIEADCKQRVYDVRQKKRHGCCQLSGVA